MLYPIPLLPWYPLALKLLPKIALWKNRSEIEEREDFKHIGSLPWRLVWLCQQNDCEPPNKQGETQTSIRWSSTSKNESLCITHILSNGCHVCLCFVGWKVNPKPFQFNATKFTHPTSEHQ